MRLKAKAILSGLATYLPGYDYMRATGGTDSARYCYSVWLRHLILTREIGGRPSIPESVAELGPGDSIGIGLAALLSGVERYYALDVVRYSDLSSNLKIFDELLSLFGNREAVPAEDEFPSLNPKLDGYEFPVQLLDDAALERALHPARVADIRRSIEQADDKDSRISYRAPWADPSLIETDSVDLIYSQAVLEHVDDLPGVYSAMRRWLKPTGMLSHQIDYRCHGKADHWNGHWTYSDSVWKIVVGKRPYLLNRVPHSEHVRLLQENGFSVIGERLVRQPSALQARNLARRFRGISEQDLTTSGAFVLATPAP
jgi:SAM-dependent methyltransferase